MKYIYEWIKKNIRPIINYTNDSNIKLSFKDRVKDIRKKTKIGIQIKFKF